MMSSLYAQITTYCNMSCPHCSFGCRVGNPNAEHMSLATYRKVLKLANAMESVICLGGGEPTIHPEFPRFLLMAMGAPNVEGVFVATNGKVQDYAVALARIAGWQGEYQFLETCLSVDPYHEEVAARVYDEFEGRGHEMRDVTQTYLGVANLGSAKKNGLGETDHCACQVPFVNPHGDIFMCGCEGSLQIGHIADPIEDLLIAITAAVTVMEHTDNCGRHYNDLYEVEHTCRRLKEHL